MSKIIVVGTLAFDTIETPFGKVERVMGGSAPFASLAAKQKMLIALLFQSLVMTFQKVIYSFLFRRKLIFRKFKLKKMVRVSFGPENITII